MHDPRTDEAIEALLAGRARRRGRPVTALVPSGGEPPLDGLETRVAWNAALHREDARQQRYSRATSIVAFRVRTLSATARNDGWLDRVASPIAHAIKRGARETDLVTRAGPSLYQVLLPETMESEAAGFADRVVGDCRVWLEAMGAPVAIHAAVAGSTGDMSLEETLDRAVGLVGAD
jgi:GGDEF domain-containing protein